MKYEGENRTIKKTASDDTRMEINQIFSVFSTGESEIILRGHQIRGFADSRIGI